MSAVEEQRVVYGASFEIPYAIGSVTIPLADTAAEAAAPASSPIPPTTGRGDNSANSNDLPAHAASDAPLLSTTSSRRRGVTSGTISSVRRCTHHRYCFLRDGGALAEDRFYRWLLHRRGEVAGNGHNVKDASASSSSSSSSSDASSPSLLYSSLDCVVFLLPSSFPQPRRVVRGPPFLIEDDTWAEHNVEVQLHFLPHLQIPPVTVVHQVLLERRTVSAASLVNSASPATGSAACSAEGQVRGVWVPQLLASTFGKPKLPPVAARVVLPGAPNPADATSFVVAEKVDMLRLYHPTERVLSHFRGVLALSALPVVQELREAFHSHFDAVAAASLDAEANTKEADVVFRFPWSLPHEDALAAYAAQRGATSVAVLRAVLTGLKRERAAMETSCLQSLEQIATLATTGLPEQLADVHERCLKLYRKE